ncbi:MAG: F0F1 ATP synthase subunit delta, partial [Paracoccus sp.]|nr:F0F1 ATP synthase subunit delta [Paracoccus sp. (in: a-proteobacteria)]
MTVANSASISADIAGRYAQALFDLVKDSGGIDALSTQIDELAQAYEDSADLRDLTVSPLYDRQQQEAAIGALAAKLGLSP